MAGTAKNYSVNEIHQGPGDLWVIGTAPTDGNVRLTLASDGTPDSATHGTCVHLGAAKSAITAMTKPKVENITLDQLDAPADGYVTELDASIEAEMAQTEAAKLQRMLGVGTYSTGSGYKQVTFGGTLVVPKACIAMISARRDNSQQHAVSILYSAIATGGFQVTMGRAKDSSYKARFTGLADLTRTAGKQVGVAYKTLANAAGGTPSAKDINIAEIFQGPCDLWLLGTAPLDAAAKVTLDATTLTPDATAHPSSVHLGFTEGAVQFSVTPKIEMIRADQGDAAIDVFIAALEAKIEAELKQTAVDKLAIALGLGAGTVSAGAYEQVTFGGTNVPTKVCIAAIGKKRSDPTKAVVCCLYSVLSSEGISLLASRQKANVYKVSFTGLTDQTRTAGKQIGVFHEMI